MKHTITKLMIGATLLLSAGTALAEITEQKATFGHGLAADHPQGMAADFFAKRVGELSDGKFEISVVPNGALGGDGQMIQAVQSGVQQFYSGSALELSSEVPELGFQDIPFLFDTVEQARAIYDGEAVAMTNEKLKEKGVVVLGWWESGFREITNSKHPINTIEDLKGLKFRTQPNPLTLDAFNALGANAQPLPWSELFVALETGAFDGQENPIVLMYTQRFYEVQNYMTLSNHVYSPFMFAVSGKFWDSLNDDERAMLQQAADEAKKFERDQAVAQVDVALAGMIEEGVEVTDLAEGEKEKVREIIKPAIDKNTANYDPAFMAKLQEELDAVRQ